MGKENTSKHTNKDSFGNFSINSMTNCNWDEIQKSQLEAAKEKSRKTYDMEMADEIIFDDLNEDINEESQVDLGSIIENMDMSDHRYRL